MKTRDCIAYLWRASGGVRGRVVVCSLVGGLHVAASLAFVWVCKKLIDAVTVGEGEPLTWYIVSMAVCMLSQTALSAIETRVMNHADIILKNRLRHKIFSGLMESRWDGKESFHTGDSLNRVMEDVRVVGESVTKSVPAVIVSAVQFLAAFFFLFALDRDLAWVVPGLLLAMLLMSRSYIKRMRKLTRVIRSREGTMQSMMQESLQHRIVIHTLEKTPYVTDNLADQQDDLRGQVLAKTDYSIFARSMVSIGFAAGYAAAFLWGVFGIRSGAATFGMMTAFLQLVGQIQRPIMNLSRQFPSLINSLTSAERLSEVSSLPAEQKGESIDLGPSVGVRFDDVSYTYPGVASPVFTGLSHDFRPGTATAVVGETGAGKSTMMRLMLALLTPDKGSVALYSGSGSDDSGSVTGSSSGHGASPQTRCNIVYVPQGNTLMSGTIRDNLLLGDPSATDDQLREVLHIAAADYVFELPEGLDTLCGEKGAGLSEGQAQRICIARSLLRKGGILLLDEPTASLDPQTEEILLKRLSESAAGRTLILVTHREAAAALCRNIVRLG
jgi:ABC-type multidrug transport system fused ATPase/permease subunit